MHPGQEIHVCGGRAQVRENLLFQLTRAYRILYILVRLHWAQIRTYYFSFLSSYSFSLRVRFFLRRKRPL